MSLHVPKPSKRFLRAAASEREGLLAHRQRLRSERERLLDEVQRVTDAMTALDERLYALAQVLGPRAEKTEEAHTTGNVGANGAAAAGTGAETPGGSARVLHGPAIRENAVRVLLDQPEFVEALHYRRWYELLADAGFAIAGKDPLAVFLTQLTRSPVVRKASQAGVYELDRQAPLRLRQRFERLQAELRELSLASVSDGELATVRARRHELDVSISQTEKALEEALRVLRRDDGAAAHRPADGAVSDLGDTPPRLAAQGGQG